MTPHFGYPFSPWLASWAKWPLAFGCGLVERVVRLAHDIQVTIVAERRR